MSDASIWVRLHRDFNAHTLAVFTLEDEQIVLSSTCSSRRTNRLGKIAFRDRQNIRRFVGRKICSSRLHIRRTSDDLFVQTISVETAIRASRKLFGWEGKSNMCLYTYVHEHGASSAKHVCRKETDVRWHDVWHLICNPWSLGVVIFLRNIHKTTTEGYETQMILTVLILNFAKAHEETLAFRLYKDLGAGRTPHKKDGVLDVPLGG